MSQMAKDMGLEPGVLNGMIEYWVQKGKLQAVQSSSEEACHTCGAQKRCPFIFPSPIYYEVVTDDTPASCCCGDQKVHFRKTDI